MNHAMNEIEELASAYSRARDELRDRVQQVQEDIDGVKRRHRSVLRRRIDAAKNAHNNLLEAVKESPEMFRRPKTRMLHGIRVGWIKQPGKVEVADEEVTISAIKRKLDDDQVEALIDIHEKLNKRSLRKLPARDLLRIGAVAVDAVDKPIARSTDSETDKLVDALMDGAETDDETIEEEAA